MSTRIQLRRDTSTNWAATNPILASGEIGYDTTTGAIKFGDGATAWSSLSAYAPPTSTLAAQATKLATARAINGVNFDGTAAITVTAAAATLTGTVLATNVVTSSLTAVGTIATGVWQGTQIADAYLATISTAGKVANSATTAASANSASAIVARDSSGNFSAGTITAALTGNVTGNLTGNVTGNVTGVVTGSLVGNVTGSVLGNVTGNASTATALLNGRTLWGQTFDGTGNVTGALTSVTAVTMSGTLTMSATASKIVPGATSFSIRNTADGADNLLVSDAGAVTVRNGLTVVAGTAALQAVTATTGLFTSTVTTGQINASVVGTVAILNNTDTAAQGRVAISGKRGGTVRWNIGFTAADTFVISSADTTQDNLVVTDAGAVTTRGPLTVSAVAGWTIGSLAGVARVSYDATGTGMFTLINAANANSSLTALSATLTGGLTVSAGITAVQALTATSGTFSATVSATYHVSTAAPAAVAAGQVGYGGTTQTTVGAAGGASALPATPRGYVIINVAGTDRVLPFYDRT